LRFYNEAAPLVEQSENDALKGSFHMEVALLFRRLAVAESRQTYIDRALIENAAASFYHERAGNRRYLARVENNLGYLYFTIGRYTDAHEHLDRARYLFIELKDVGTAAQVDDTRAQTLLAEGRLIEAERLVRSAVRTLERGDEQAVLAEALTTFGTVKARLGKSVRARELLDRAISVAETAGDLEGAGRAKLSIIEELSQRTSHTELASIFESAADLLQQSQDPTTSKRLISCARKVIAALGAAESIDKASSEDKEDIFSLRKEVRSKEKALIERALREAGGSVTKASRLLGFKHHQSLINLIVGRHSDLLNVRSAVRKRRRHLFSQPKRSKTRTRKIVPDASPSETSILHIEDHKLVAQLVKDLLVAENWRVELCVDGDTALRKLTDEDRYDAIVVDYELPGLSGIELVKRARKITHRRRTPIIMLSASDYETEAWRAGVDAFLRKPEQINQLPTTISRLLRNSSKA
jgi:CheY-like chemotaxis protein